MAHENTVEHKTFEQVDKERDITKKIKGYLDLLPELYTSDEALKNKGYLIKRGGEVHFKKIAHFFASLTDEQIEQYAKQVESEEDQIQHLKTMRSQANKLQDVNFTSIRRRRKTADIFNSIGAFGGSIGAVGLFGMLIVYGVLNFLLGISVGASATPAVIAAASVGFGLSNPVGWGITAGVFATLLVIGLTAAYLAYTNEVAYKKFTNQLSTMASNAKKAVTSFIGFKPKHTATTDAQNKNSNVKTERLAYMAELKSKLPTIHDKDSGKTFPSRLKKRKN